MITAGMSSGDGRMRRSADSRIGVYHIVDALERFVAARGNRDLAMLMRGVLKSTTWKTAAQIGPLAEVADLYGILAEVAPNAILPPKFTAKAIERMHEVISS